MTRFPPGQRWCRQAPKGDAAAGGIHTGAEAPTTTLTAEGRVKPLNPLHLLNPHARQGVSMQAPTALPRSGPLPPLTWSPSPIDGGGKFLEKRGPPIDGTNSKEGCVNRPLPSSRYLFRHAFHGQGEWVIGVLVYEQSAIIGSGRYGQVFVGKDMGHRESQGFREDCFFFLRTG